MNQEIIILLAHERSGTNMLRGILGSASTIYCESEICKIETEVERNSQRNFFNYRSRAIAADPRFAYPLPDSQTELIRAYFDELIRLNRATPKTVVDIKYGHIHNFNTFWTANATAPFIFNFARDSGTKVIHLFRRHALLAVLSNELAISRQLWNTQDTAELENLTIKVNVHRVLRETLRLVRWQQDVREHLHQVRSIELTYEELLENGELAAESSTSISKFLEVASDWNPRPALVKVSPPIEQFVENLDELKTFFKANDASHLC